LTPAAAIVSAEDAERLVAYLLARHPASDPRVAAGPTGAQREVRTLADVADLEVAIAKACHPGDVIDVRPWDPRAAAWLEIVRALARYDALVDAPRRLRVERTPLRGALLTWALAAGSGRSVLADHMADDVVAELERRVELQQHRRSGDAWAAIECRLRTARMDGLASGALTRGSAVYLLLVERQHAAGLERRTARMREGS
jgi:hypothetical protein